MNRPSRFPLLLWHHATNRYAVAWLFEPHDLWLGAYWRLGREGPHRVLTVYVCLLPCLPLRLGLVIKDESRAR